MMKIDLALLSMFLIGFALIAFAMLVSVDNIQYVDEAGDWCTEAGGVFIYPRTGPDVCIDLEVVILFPEERE
jgi:hypothetical protein